MGLPDTRLANRRGKGSSRAALLDATLNLVRKQGWTATTVDQLCQSAHVTKGAFFHHFASKEELGVAAAQRWSEVTSVVFSNAGYHLLADPLDRILGYLDFRAAMAKGPLEGFTCFAGTTVQEMFATSDMIRVAAGKSILSHAHSLAADFHAAIEAYPPRSVATAESLAVYSQSVLQGGFVLAKALGNAGPLLDAIAHLKRYLALLFNRELES